MAHTADAMRMRDVVLTFAALLLLLTSTDARISHNDDGEGEYGSAFGDSDDEDNDQASALPPDVYDDRPPEFMRPKFSRIGPDGNFFHADRPSIRTVAKKTTAVTTKSGGGSSVALALIVVLVIVSLLFAVAALCMIKRKRREDRQEYKRVVPAKRV